MGAVDATRFGNLISHVHPEEQWGIDTALTTIFDPQ